MFAIVENDEHRAFSQRAREAFCVVFSAETQQSGDVWNDILERRQRTEIGEPNPVAIFRAQVGRNGESRSRLSDAAVSYDRDDPILVQ